VLLPQIIKERGINISDGVEPIKAVTESIKGDIAKRTIESLQDQLEASSLQLNRFEDACKGGTLVIIVAHSQEVCV
jgi:hypothetical protein